MCLISSFLTSSPPKKRLQREMKAESRLVNLRTFSFSYATVQMPYITLNHINQAAHTHYSPFKLWKLTTLQFDRWSLTFAFQHYFFPFSVRIDIKEYKFLCINIFLVRPKLYCKREAYSHSLTFMENILIFGIKIFRSLHVPSDILNAHSRSSTRILCCFYEHFRLL